jgi:membrane-bound metal-dependent hydrolase YbcI (DUF457 family)
MLLMAHTIITLGTATVIAAAIKRNGLPQNIENKTTDIHQPARHLNQSTLGTFAQKPWSWLSSLGKLMDIRILLIGSLLPDIIDKPIGLFFFKEFFGNNGRIFGHTLLFFIVITIIGVFLYMGYRRNWFLVLSFGTFIHLILDQMWLNTTTLLWPLFGSFEKFSLDFTNWLKKIIDGLINNPATFTTEMIGVAIAIWLVWILWRKGALYRLIRYGRI